MASSNQQTIYKIHILFHSVYSKNEKDIYKFWWRNQLYQINLHFLIISWMISDTYIIPTNLFEKQEPFILGISRIALLENFTNLSSDKSHEVFSINRQKYVTLFYVVDCMCKYDYVGERKRKITRCGEHNSPTLDATLTLSWRKSFVDLHSKSIDWFYMIRTSVNN